MRIRHSIHRSAFSIVEVVISALIIGSVGVIAMNGIAQTYQSQLDTTDLSMADLLARELMEEAMQAEYDFDASELAIDGGTRQSFRFLDEYHNWNADRSKPAQFKDGTLLPVGSGWSRTVEVTGIPLADMGYPNKAGVGSKLVTVTVLRSDRRLAQLKAYKTKFTDSIPTFD